MCETDLHLDGFRFEILRKPFMAVEIRSRLHLSMTLYEGGFTMQQDSRIVELVFTPEQLKVLSCPENVPDSIIASQIAGLIQQVGDTFGTVRWYDEDIRNALERADIEPTAENVAKIRDKCSHHFFTDCMIETGWNCIDAYIAEIFP